jgi:hypothetical protein
MLKIMVGVLKPVEVMPGAKCTAHSPIKTVVVVNFAFPASGVRQEVQQFTVSKSNVL